MANKAAIKSRIKSINATKKITGAMELISSVKLQKQRNQMLKNREYADTLKSTVAKICSGENEIDNQYLNKKDAPLKYYFVFGSDMGLCGGYNINIIKFIQENISKEDYLFVVGLKAYSTLKKEGYNVINGLVLSDEADYLLIKKNADTAIQMFRENKIASINVIYTRFINNVSFAVSKDCVLPSEIQKDNEYKEIIFEPSPGTILDELIPMMAENEIYARFLESKTSEQGSRRFAMENATDNANELTDKLLLAYNQARQAAITQEITEIVSGADAL